MQVDVGPLILIVVPCVTGLVWLIRLEGRVNLTESRFVDLKADIAELKQLLRKP